MTEPLRTAPASEGSADADRDALIERLLLAGLDHYFEGRYEQAVNLWTRVAFLERGHGRARAYIERARGALAERQRETEESLHHGLEAYRSGDLTNARELLTRAVTEGGSDTALVFLQRLGIAEAGHAAAATLPVGSPAVLPGQPLMRRYTDKRPAPRPTNWIATPAPGYGPTNVSVGVTPEGVKISPDGKFVAVTVMNGTNAAPGSAFYNDNGLLQVWTRTGAQLTKAAELPIGKWCQGVVWSANGKTLLVQCMVEEEITVVRFSGKALTKAGTIKTKGGPAGIRTAEP